MGLFGDFGLPDPALLDWFVPISRRRFLGNSLAAMVGAALPIGAYSQFLEPHHLTVEFLELRVPSLPEAFDGFRIAQLSDLHYLPYTRKPEIAAAVDRANSLHPDLTVLTGDFVTSSDAPGAYKVTDAVYSHMAVCAELVSHLKARHGVYACSGNHDASIGTAYVQAALGDFGIVLLRNESRPLERDGARLWIAAIDDAVHDNPDFARTVAKVPKEEVIVLLAHEPDLADETVKYPIAVQLSGHSHGGQIRLPIIGCPYLPTLAQKYPFGYYRVGNLQLYTNRGIGEILLPYRFNAPPEITLFTLRRAS